MRRVVVTGMGIVSSIGNNIQEVTASLHEAKSGITFSPEFEEHGFRSRVYGRYEAQRDRHTTPEQVWLRMATIKGSGETPAAARAAEARGQLLAGTAFAEVAKTCSRSSGSAASIFATM